MTSSSEQFRMGDSVVVKTPGLTIWGRVIGILAGPEPELRIQRDDTNEVILVKASHCKRLKRPVTTRVNRSSSASSN